MTTSKKVIILLSDIDTMFAQVCKNKFSHIPNWDATITSSYTEALSTIMSDQPNLILTDIILKGGNGFDLLSEVRNTKNKNIADTPVIILTDLEQAENKKHATELGATMYMIKSEVTLSDVIKHIQKLLDT